MSRVSLIFPHQLFRQSPAITQGQTVYLIEEFLFFRQFNFHKQKLLFHRASMKSYQEYLIGQGLRVEYIDTGDSHADIRVLVVYLSREKSVTKIDLLAPCDDWLERRITSAAKAAGVELHIHDSDYFLLRRDELGGFFKPDKKKFYQTQFYIDQRKRFDVLLEGNEEPVGGKWSFDTDNRKKYPKGKQQPFVQVPRADKYSDEARRYVEREFPNNLGELSETPIYPTNFEDAEGWLDDFLEQRFTEFGPYEDAILSEPGILHHSLLTPMLNTGLITPKQIIDKTLVFAAKNQVPLNSLEGFIRQIIGWREFIRGVYVAKGRQERTTNFWGFTRKIPPSFYEGSTGIAPVDITIQKVLKTGYCHHIERLMVLGNFMLLCEFDPDEVYRWFMELFIDAYDWVMVPNVYGMSQFADGGLMSTKPYISGSNYLMKMSNYEKGEWQATWDALFWTFLSKQRDFFLKNPRLAMLCRNYDKLDQSKKNNYEQTAQAFYAELDEALRGAGGC